MSVEKTKTESKTETKISAAKDLSKTVNASTSVYTTSWATLADIMRRNVVTVSPEKTVSDAAKIMRDKNVSCIIVTDHDDIAGIVTETDFIRKVIPQWKEQKNLTVQDIIASPVVTMCQSVQLVEASQVMEDNKVKRLPVTSDGRLVGIITQTDLIQAMTAHIYCDISEIASRDIYSVEVGSTIIQVAQKMASDKISCLVIKDKDRVAGIITEKDIVKKVIAPENDPSTTKVDEIMTSSVVSVPGTYSAFSTSKIMDTKGIGRVLVMDNDKLIGIVTQTDIFKAAKKLLDEQKRNSIMQSESSGNAICDIRPDFTVTYINPALAHLLCVENQDEIVGKRFLPPKFWQTPQDAENFLNELKTGEIELRELELKSATGKKLNLTVFVTFDKNPQGQTENIRIVIYDITAKKELAAQKRLEHDLKESKKKLKEALKKAERAQSELAKANRKLETSAHEANNLAQEAMVNDLTKSQFLASMSHEIRTPLNAIIGLSEVLTEEKLNNEQKNYLGMIRQSAHNMLILINDILDFSKIQAGSFDVNISEYSVEHLLAVVESLVRPQIIDKDLEFKVNQVTDLPIMIQTDPVRLRQCLLNLVNFALSCTEKGYISLNLSMDKKDNGNYIKFEIEDTSKGLPQDKLESIFESFTHDNVTPDTAGKIGLGLAIAKKIANLLGGDVWITSEVDKGTKLSLSIPTGINTENQSTFNNSDRIEKASNSTEDKTFDDHSFTGKVLVAEDTPTNQTLIRLLLEKLGLQVTIVEDGLQAVEAVKNDNYDAVLMDIQMPNMNGFEATKVLRKEGFLKPVIAVTAHAMKGDREKCLDAGCDDYISKPINRDELVKVLKIHLPVEGNEFCQEVENINSQVKELTDMAMQEDQQMENSLNDFSADIQHCPVDWQAVTELCDDPDVINQVVEMFLNDSPRCIGSLAEAIKDANPKHIRMYAHSLKGASLQIGAQKLADVAYKLECAGRDKEFDNVPELFNKIQDEYGKLSLFLAEPDWMNQAKQQQSQTA